MPTGSRRNPYPAFRFIIEVDGIAVAQAAEVSGIEADTETEIYEEGGVNDHVHLLPKRTRYRNITLKRGLTDLDDLWRWHQDVVAGSFKRRNGSVILLDYRGEEKWRWNFSQAYPVKWTGPELRAGVSAVAFEAVELAHNGIKKG